MRFLDETKIGRAKGYLVLMGRCVHEGGNWTVYRGLIDEAAYVRVQDADVIRGPEDIEEKSFGLDNQQLQGLLVKAGARADVRLGDEQWTTTIRHQTEPVIYIMLGRVRDTACISGVVFERQKRKCLGVGFGKWDWVPRRPRPARP
jgi:hypothetical protein